jgi:hypothetical protein
MHEKINITEELGKLERMKQSGFLSDLELTQAKSALLSSNKVQQANEEHLESLRVKTALNQLDANWDYAQDQYKVTGRYGVRYLPTKLSATVVGVLPTIAAAVIAYVCLSPSSNLAPDNPLRSAGPAISVFMTLYSIWTAQKHYQIVLAYEKAKAEYHSERSRIRYQRKS